MSSDDPAENDLSADRLDTVEKDLAGRWFEAVAARLRSKAQAWAMYHGMRGVDAEHVADEAMTDLAKRLAEKGDRLDDGADWDGVRAQLVVAVRNKALNAKRQGARKPGNFGRGRPADEGDDPLAQLADSLDVEPWSASNFNEMLSTKIGAVVGEVKRDAGRDAWKTYFDVKIRGLPAKEVQEKYGYAAPEEVYRVVEKVTRLLRKRLAQDGR